LPAVLKRQREKRGDQSRFKCRKWSIIMQFAERRTHLRPGGPVSAATSEALPPVAAGQRREQRTVSVRQQATLLGVLHLSERLRRLRDVSPSLSRACLGKMIMLMYKWGKKTIFMYEWLRRRLIAWVMICPDRLGRHIQQLDGARGRSSETLVDTSCVRGSRKGRSRKGCTQMNLTHVE